MIASVRLKVTAADSDARVSVGGTPVGSEGIAIALTEGSNAIRVQVTGEDGVSTRVYTVTLNRRSVAEFAQEAYVKASNTDARDNFGTSIAIDDYTLAVAAYQEDSAATGVNGDQSDNSAINSGAAYVFTRDGAGVWSQQAYLKASNTERTDSLGFTMALDGNTLAVAALEEDSAATGVNGDQTDNAGTGSGAVYVYTRDLADLWSQQAYLKASNPDRQDRFGIGLAIEGDTLAVGAWEEDSAATGVDGDQADNSARYAGAVYIFSRDGSGTWAQQAYLKASNTEAGDRFGISLALSGDTLAVGARDEDSAAPGVNAEQANNAAPDSGAVYVFTRNSTGLWSQQAYLKSSNPDSEDRFGMNLTLDGDTLVVGANGEDSAATGLNGDQSDNSAAGAGAVYVFTRDRADVWSQQAYLKASNAEAWGSFGAAVGLAGNTLAVGAFGENSAAMGINGDQTDISAEHSGAVYIFIRDAAGVWSQQVHVKASNAEAWDGFGVDLAVSGNTLAVVARHEMSASTGVNGDQSDNSAREAGAVYVFR